MSANLHVSDEVSKLYEKLQVKRDKLREQLAEVEKEFEAVSTTLKLMGLPTPGMSNLELAGKTHLDALIAIARANNGLLVVKTARRLMTRAGLFKNPKNASSVLFTAISRSGKFESEGKGKYKLKEENESSPHHLIVGGLLVPAATNGGVVTSARGVGTGTLTAPIHSAKSTPSSGGDKS